MAWYKEEFMELRPEWYVFPWGKPRPKDPTRHVTTLKTAWRNVCGNAKVKGRFHDNRHTLITELAESGAGDQTIMDIAGHVSKQMLKHYSHIRMEAKRKALESILQKQTESDASDEQSAQAWESLQKLLQGLQNGQGLDALMDGIRKTAISPKNEMAQSDCSPSPANTHVFEGESLQKSLQSCNFQGHRGVVRAYKSKKRNGSSGRTRKHSETYFQQHAEQRMTLKTHRKPPKTDKRSAFRARIFVPECCSFHA